MRKVVSFTVMVTGPAYGTQQASSALQFVQAVIKAGHKLMGVFFYHDGVYNANQFTSPASDEYDLVRAWQTLHKNYNIKLYICVAAAMRRGVADTNEAKYLGLPAANMQAGFSSRGLGTLVQASLSCDRMIQF